jgi:hypothetical protein
MACDTSQANLNLGDCYALNSTQTVGQVYTSPAVLVNLLVRNIFIIAGIILFFLIMYAGFLFITGNVKGKDKAKEVLQGAIIGFLVMFAAFWIVQIIKVVTGADIPL